MPQLPLTNADVMNLRPIGVLALVMGACFAVQVGCVRSTRHDFRQQTEVAKLALSPEEAAELAAQLANQDCERKYKRQPFQPGQHKAVLQDGFYHWGQLDIGGIAGFSAMVSFRQDGSEPRVEVYFSSDALGVR